MNNAEFKEIPRIWGHAAPLADADAKTFMDAAIRELIR